ncbi:MAG TPA: tetratricopeptide repeat protein, partial [Anaeromyxobacteraceae bacterium]|nr:tetratricopeptide repeat protein [Anaeromyxobacteraceae bacterium]
MAPSIVEKYEQILAADPRSRIFVELAKALLERGDAARAIEVCQRGLEHHPSSILGRVIWGRALLETGDVRAALDHFDIAIALDPGSPYAYNLVGEALVKRGLFREALPVLARAAELQPADARVQAWLDEAMRRAREPAPAPAPAETEEAASSISVRGEPVEPRTEGARPPEAEQTAPYPIPTVAAPAAPELPPDEAVTVTVPLPQQRPPPLKHPTPPPTREVTSPRFVLSMLPGEARDDFDRVVPAAPAAPAVPAPTPTPDPDAAAAIAARYEQELREKLLAEAAPPPPGLLRRHRGAVAIAAVLVALAGAVATYLVVRSRGRAEEAAGAAARARVGIARDTRAALEQAAEALARAREHVASPELTALAAEANAILAAEHGDEDAGRLARALAADPAAGEGALVARALLAATPAERKTAEQAVLATGSAASPLVQALAGRILLARGEADAGRGRLLLAAAATPPILRALADLGDAALAAGDPEGALSYHLAALEKMPTHPRAAAGAAEARLALRRDLPAALRTLEAVEADAGSAPPLDLRERHELAVARVLAATGRRDDAALRLARAGERLGKRAAISAALAELHLAVRDWDRAEAEAARAVSLEPK